MNTNPGPTSGTEHDVSCVRRHPLPDSTGLTRGPLWLLLLLSATPEGVLADYKSGTGHSTDEWMGEWVILDATYHNYQFNDSAGKMLAVSSDGIVHGSYTGGEYGSPSRRVMTWCVDPGTMTLLSPPATPLPVRTGFTTSAVTGPNPANGLEPNSGVIATHTTSPAFSWVGTDFGGCTLAFNMFHPSGTNYLWPRIAVDGNDRIHMVCSGTEDGVAPDGHVYNASSNGTQFESPDYLTLFGTCEPIGAIPIAHNHTDRAAIACFRQTGDQDVSDPDSLAGRLHNDLLVYTAENGNLTSRILAGPPVNMTNYGPGAGDTFGPDRPEGPQRDVPFGPYGYRACGQVDGLFDVSAREDLHLVLTTAPVFHDTLTVRGRAGRVEVLPFVDYSYDRGMIWHLNVDSRRWSVVAGSNCGITEQDFSAPQRRGYRMRNDSPQLAVDPATGFLYTIWSEYSMEDLTSEGYPNREIMARCSADNGVTWGPGVNLSQTMSPGCWNGDCFSEDWISMATYTSGGYLHIQFVRDRHPGWDYVFPPEPVYPPCEVVYQKVPVGAVPPHTGAPWNAAGRVGLANPARTVIRTCDEWSGEQAWLDSAHWVESVHVFNESPVAKQVDGIRFYHHPDDPLGTPADGGLLSLGLEVQADGQWIPISAWDGRLPAWRGTRFRAQVAYSGLPGNDQLLVFQVDGHPDLVYRIAYASDTPGCPDVEMLDPANLIEYTAEDLMSVSVDPGLHPAGFTLEPNWPNPFNPATTIAFSLDYAGAASLTVHNLLGETVATLVDGPVQAGRHTVDFDASALASGVYIYTLEAGGRSESRKLVLMR
jgi:hypothetical protein